MGLYHWFIAIIVVAVAGWFLDFIIMGKIADEVQKISSETKALHESMYEIANEHDRNRD